MKKSILIIVGMIFILSITGCSKGEEKEAQQTISNTTEATETSEEGSFKDNLETEENKSLDNTLTGLSLLESLEYKMPKHIMIETEATGMNGMVSKAKTYYKNDNFRMETENPALGTQVVIYNAEEGATYQYTKGEMTGIVMYDDEDSDSDSDSDMSMPTLADLAEDASEDVIARVEKLDGEEVIYIETIETEEMGDSKACMWYSSKYSVPMKSEMYVGGELMFRSVVTNIDANAKINDELFALPTDIDISEYSMDDMFGGMEE